MQRATRPVTLATLTRLPCRASKSGDFVAGSRRCDIGLTIVAQK